MSYWLILIAKSWLIFFCIWAGLEEICDFYG